MSRSKPVAKEVDSLEAELQGLLENDAEKAHVDEADVQMLNQMLERCKEWPIAPSLRHTAQQQKERYEVKLHLESAMTLTRSTIGSTKCLEDVREGLADLHARIEEAAIHNVDEMLLKESEKLQVETNSIISLLECIAKGNRRADTFLEVLQQKIYSSIELHIPE
eukprot:Filipodium_phascolosomae@DN1552_c0_g1_i3.p1